MHMRSTLRRLTALSAVLALTLGAAACGGGDSGSSGSSGGGGFREGGTVKFAYPSFPDYLDPALSYTVAGIQALSPTYTTLLTYRHEEGAAGAQLIPGLAEAMPKVSNGGKTYTFKLRKGLKYSDGSPVKANDFEHEIKRVISLESGAAPFYTGAITGAAQYEKAGKPGGDISGITADEGTRQIKVELNEPNGQFPFIVAMPFAALVPSDTKFENLTRNPPPGVGPYKITKVEGSRSFTMQKNENWPKIPGIPSGHVDTIQVDKIGNNERAVRSVLENKYDWMDDPSAGDALREFKQTGKDRYKEYTTNSTYYFFLNERVKPFDNENVRKAVNLAIDRSRALPRLFGRQLTPSCNFLPPGMEGFQKIDPCPYGDPTQPPDVEKAREIIKDEGVAGQSVKVWGNDEEQTTAVTNYLADVLNSIGFKAKPQIVDGDVYFQTIGNQKTKAQAGFANWFQDFPHPGDFFLLVDPDSIQETNNQNYGNVDDPKVKQAIDQLNPKPLDEAAQGYADLDKYLVDHAHVVPYGNRKLPVFFSNRIAVDQYKFHPVIQTDFTTFALKK
jgi:peptide/nickel transport system substrate-binding protein